MPKQKQSLVKRMIAFIKRNPLATITTLVGIFAGIPGAALGLNYAYERSEPVVPALRGWVRDHVAEVAKPILLTQNSQAVAIDRFILFQQQEALSKAKTDPAANTSPVVQERIRDLTQQVQDTAERLRRAGGHDSR